MTDGSFGAAFFACVLALRRCSVAAEEEPLAWRGYCMTFMRTPTMGLAERRQALDCIQEDGGNMLLLWATCVLEADWMRPSPMLAPRQLKERAARERWPAEREMARIAAPIAQKWGEAGF